MRHAWIILMLALLAGCGAPGRVFLSVGWTIDRLEWTEAEKALDVAVLEVRRNAYISVHVVRLKGAESPHVHDRHDLTVFVLSGTVRMHLGDRVHVVGKGDVGEIPHGLTHWAENAGADAAEAYIVFNPPFDGKDRRPVKPSP